MELYVDDDGKYAFIYMWLDYGEYDMYHVIPGKDGHLTISEIVLWQDDCCANTYVNHVKAIDDPYAGFGVDEEDILSSIHDYSLGLYHKMLHLFVNFAVEYGYIRKTHTGN